MLLEWLQAILSLTNALVLILIVMEDALRVYYRQIIYIQSTAVLILIVMEDALRGQISKFPDIPNPLSLFM